MAMLLTVQKINFGLIPGTEVVLGVADSDEERTPWLELRVFVDASIDSLSDIRRQAIEAGYQVLSRILEDRTTQ